MDAATNLQNMKKLDDSWNGQDLQTFRKYHTKDCIVRWPNQPPTNGIEAHVQEAIAFFKMFPDQHLVNNPYKIMDSTEKAQTLCAGGTTAADVDSGEPGVGAGFRPRRGSVRTSDPRAQCG